MQQRWYRLEIVVFAARDADSSSAARPRLLETVQLPRHITPLTPDEGEPVGRLPFAQTLAPDDAVPLIIADVPPPVWFAGECVAEFWQPPGGLTADRPIPPDPCLPDPEQESDEALPANAEPTMDQAPSVVAKPQPLDPRTAALAVLEVAFRDYEDELLRSSYAMRHETSALRADLRRLRQRYDIVLAGSWHQPLPPRDSPLALLVQLGEMDADQRLDLEGWFSVTVGRLIHFEARLQYRLADGGVALLDERRAMRSRTLHYLDHPATRMLIWAEPISVPESLAQQLAEARGL